MNTDYEKKYNEAFGWAKTIYDNPNASNIRKEWLEQIFPELRESEDERIRKVIYKLMLGMRDEIFTAQDESVTKEKVLAYLERQKEQKPAELTKKEHDYCIGFTDGKREVLDNLERYGLRKSAGLSEDDKKTLNCARYWLNDRLEARNALDISTPSCELSVSGVIKRLDSILSRPQPKQEWNEQEWSEEDEDAVRHICRYLGYHCNEATARGCKEWLNNRLKSLRPQPHWKPSDEQMKALEECGECKRCIKSLYNELLKLK